MTEHERKIAVLLASIAQGNLTVNQLKRIVADGKARLISAAGWKAPQTLASPDINPRRSE